MRNALLFYKLNSITVKIICNNVTMYPDEVGVFGVKALSMNHWLGTAVHVIPSLLNFCQLLNVTLIIKSYSQNVYSDLYYNIL